MAQEIINVGTSANDGTGDALRNAFIKSNNNFTELYANRISGSGTDNYIPRFNGTNALENSIIFDNGTFVGIGTSLSVGNDYLSIFYNTATSRNQAINIKDTNSSANGSIFSVFRKSDDTYLGAISRNGTSDAMFVYGNDHLALGSGATERMRITSGGNVGIGTSSATYRTQIETTGADVFLTKNTSSTSFNRSYFYNNNNVGIQFLNFGSAYAFGTEFGVGQNGSVIQSNTTSSFAVGTSGAYPLILGTNGSERMRIKSTGIVNISNVPSSSAGLSSGDIYKDASGFLKIV